MKTPLTGSAPIGDFANRIIQGDCITVMQKMPARSVDFVVTDPPYIVSYRSRDGKSIANDDNSHWLKPAFQQVYRVLKDDSFCVCFYGWNRIGRFMDAWRSAGFYPVGHFTAVKHYASRSGFTRACHESAYLLAKGRPSKPTSPPSDILPWHYSGNRLHPTQKPVITLHPLIQSYSKVGDIVLDPFSGSGTTAVAARQLGRRYIGIELNSKHCAVAQSRRE